jgi:hypothetical protein
MDYFGLLKWWHYVCYTKNEKCGFKKYVIVIKIKIGHHKMNNLIVKCIENFPISIFSYLKF